MGVYLQDLLQGVDDRGIIDNAAACGDVAAGDAIVVLAVDVEDVLAAQHVDRPFRVDVLANQVAGIELNAEIVVAHIGNDLFHRVGRRNHAADEALDGHAQAVFLGNRQALLIVADQRLPVLLVAVIVRQGIGLLLRGRGGLGAPAPGAIGRRHQSRYDLAAQLRRRGRGLLKSAQRLFRHRGIGIVPRAPLIDKYIGLQADFLQVVAQMRNDLIGEIGIQSLDGSEIIDGVKSKGLYAIRDLLQRIAHRHVFRNGRPAPASISQFHNSKPPVHCVLLPAFEV